MCTASYTSMVHVPCGGAHKNTPVTPSPSPHHTTDHMRTTVPPMNAQLPEELTV